LLTHPYFINLFHHLKQISELKTLQTQLSICQEYHYLVILLLKKDRMMHLVIVPRKKGICHFQIKFNHSNCSQLSTLQNSFSFIKSKSKIKNQTMEETEEK